MSITSATLLPVPRAGMEGSVDTVVVAADASASDPPKKGRLLIASAKGLKRSLSSPPLSLSLLPPTGDASRDGAASTAPARAKNAFSGSNPASPTRLHPQTKRICETITAEGFVGLGSSTVWQWRGASVPACGNISGLTSAAPRETPSPPTPHDHCTCEVPKPLTAVVPKIVLHKPAS